MESETTSVKFVLCSIKLHSLAKISCTWNGSYIYVCFFKNLVIWKILVDSYADIPNADALYNIKKSHSYQNITTNLVHC